MSQNGQPNEEKNNKEVIERMVGWFLYNYNSLPELRNFNLDSNPPPSGNVEVSSWVTTSLFSNGFENEDILPSGNTCDFNFYDRNINIYEILGEQFPEVPAKALIEAVRIIYKQFNNV